MTREKKNTNIMPCLAVEGVEGGGVGKRREDSGCSHAAEETSSPQVTEFPIQRSAPSLMNAESVQRVDLYKTLS